MKTMHAVFAALTMSTTSALVGCGGGGDDPVTAREGTLAVAASALSGAGDCPNDSKLLNNGPTAVYGEGPGTAWGVITDGLHDAGFGTDPGQDAAAIAYLNRIFGVDFATLQELKAYNLQLIDIAWDLNRNGFVCLFDLRGTRAYTNDPSFNLTNFGISDDRLKKK